MKKSGSAPPPAPGGWTSLADLRWTSLADLRWTSLAELS